MIDRLIAWLAQLGGHRYLSTACLHGDCAYCVAPTVTREGKWERLGPSYSADEGEAKTPATCKFCDAPCRHHCHGGGRR